MSGNAKCRSLLAGDCLRVGTILSPASRLLHFYRAFRQDFGDPTAVWTGKGDRIELGERHPDQFRSQFFSRYRSEVDRFHDLKPRNRAALLCQERTALGRLSEQAGLLSHRQLMEIGET